MSTKDLLYTNKFTPSLDEDEIPDHQKQEFRRNYENKNGIPNDLTNNNNNYLSDYNVEHNKKSGEYITNIDPFPNPLNRRKTKKVLKDNDFSVDSKFRNATLYPNPNSFKVQLPKRLSNIYKIQIISCEFPNTEQVIRNQPASKKNNKIYWKNYDDGDIEYSITITDGNYSSARFATELQNKLNSVERSGPSSIGIPHNFTVSVNAVTNIFSLTQNLTSLVSNPFTISKDSKVMTVKHFDHNFDTGQIISVSSSSRVGGIDTSLINSSHLISVDLKRIDSIVWDESNTRLNFTVGVIDRSETSGYTSVTGEINGKLLVNKGSRSITGINTDFLTNSLTDTRKIIHFGNYDYIINNVNSNTILTLETEAQENFNGKDNLVINSITFNNATNKIRVFMDYMPSPMITRLDTSGSLSFTIKKYSDDTNLFSSVLNNDDINYTYAEYINYGANYFDIQISNLTDSNANDYPDVIDDLMYAISTEIEPKAYFYYTDYINDHIVNFNKSRKTLGKGSIATGGNIITGNLDNYNITVAFNSDLNIIALGGSGVNGFTDDELLQSNYTEGSCVVVSDSVIDTTNPINIESVVNSYSITSINELTLDATITYSVGITTITYPPSASFTSGQSVPRFEFSLTKTAPTSIDNVFEAPQLFLVKDKTYVIELENSIDTNNLIKFSTISNGIHNSGTEFTHSDITYNGGSYTVVVSDGLYNTVGSISNTLYYYSSQNDSEGELLAQGGYLYFMEDDSDFRNNLDYNPIGTNTDIPDSGKLFLSGKFMGVTKNGTSGNAILYAPKHGINTLQIDTTKNRIMISSSSNDARYNATGYEFGLVSNVVIPDTVANGELSNLIRVYSTGIADVLVVDDTIVIQSADETFPFVGAFIVNSVVNDSNSSTLDYVTITATAVYKNNVSRTYTINNDNASELTYFKGTGYVNGNANHYYHQIVDIVDEDHFEIDYPYVGSENGYWSEIITSTTTGTKCGMIGKYSLGTYGTRFLSEYSVNDYVFIGSENHVVSAIASDYQMTINANVSAQYNNSNLYKNASIHTLENGDNISFMETKSIIDDRILDFIGVSNETTSVTIDEENNLLFDDSNLQTTAATSANGIDIGTISGIQFYISNVNNVPNYLKNNDGNALTDIKYYRHNSKYFVILNTAATDDALSKGGDSVSIGKDIKFSMLFSYSDTPGELLGFPNVGDTTLDETKTTTLSDGNVLQLNLGDTEFNSVQSNTTKVDIVNVESSVKSPSEQFSEFVLITTTEAHSFANGDIIYIRNHTGSVNDNAVNSDLGHTIVYKSSTEFYIPIQFNDTYTSTGASPNGFAYKKQLYRPFVLAGKDYVFLRLKGIENITSSYDDDGIPDKIARISLSGVPGSVLFNTQLGTPKIYYNGLLKELDSLTVEIRDPDGELFEFNNANFSFTVRITEVIDIIEGSGISSRTGNPENIFSIDGNGDRSDI